MAGVRPSRVDTLSVLAGVPMVAWAVRCLLATALVDHVVVLDAAVRHQAVLGACSGLPVSVHAELREALAPMRSSAGPAGHLDGAGRAAASSGDIVLLHDAARPLAPPALAESVVRAVAPGHLAVVPVRPLSDTVKQVDDAGIVRATPDRAGLRVLQTPHVVRRELLDDGFAQHPLTAAAHAAAGGAVHMVEGDPMAFPVHTAWDLELAQLLVDREGTP